MRPAVVYSRLLAILGLALAPLGSGVGSVIFVPADQPTIQAGIDAAADHDSVIVLPGTYTENIDFGGKAITVSAAEGADQTAIDGGNIGTVVRFAGGETPESTLSGFSIVNGHAIWGGGIYCEQAAPTITNNHISNNYAASKGGGIYCRNCSPTIAGNTIAGNRASASGSSSAYGGGICCWDASAPIIHDNIIENNSAEYTFLGASYGGGICCWGGSSPSISSNIISGNESAQEGGGICCLVDSDPELVNNTIIGSVAELGGGIYTTSSSDPTLSNTIFWSNAAPIGAEGYIGSSCTLRIDYSDVDGGPESIHVDPQGNLEWGAGMIAADPLFVDPGSHDYRLQPLSPCIDAGDPQSPPDPDSTRADMGARWFDHRSAPFLLLLSPDPLLPGENGTFDVTGALPAAPTYLYYSWTGSGDTYIPELDVTLGIDAPILAAGPTVTDSSGALTWVLPVPESAAGRSIWIQAAQQRQASNVIASAIFRLPLVFHVPQDYSTIQEALTAAADRDTIIVSPGTYVENIDFLGKGVTLRSAEGPEATVIDGGQAGGVVMFHQGEGSNSVLAGFTITHGLGYWWYSTYDPYSGGITCLAASPTITNNIIVDNSYETSSGYGGGIFCRDASPLISANVIAENSSGNGGGIAFRERSAPTIRGNLILRNSITYSGGGIYCSDESAGVVSDNIISDNSADWWAGGIMSYDSSPLISGNLIRANETNGQGGGVCCIRLYAGSPCPTLLGNSVLDNHAERGGGIYCARYDAIVLANNTIAGNTALRRGGGIYIDSECGAVLTNNTITGNRASLSAAGLYADLVSHADAVNLILWGDEAADSTEIGVGLGSTVTVDHSDVAGGWIGTGNIDTDPLFADPLADDYHLTFGSPCRNRGNNAAAALPVADFEGDPRIHEECVDMGADEFHTHLYACGPVRPGASVAIKVVGEPHTPAVELGLGAGVQDPPRPTPCGDLYLQRPIQPFPLGAIPEDGVLVQQAVVPSDWLPGEQHPLQALLGPPAPGSELTNLLVLEVRDWRWSPGN